MDDIFGKFGGML